MLIPLFLINILDLWLINKLFKNSLFLYLASFIPLLQSILVFLRYLITQEPFTDPTLTIEIIKEDAYQIMFIYSCLILLILIPILILVKNQNIFPFNYSLSDIKNLIINCKNSQLYINFSAILYPAWGISTYIFGNKGFVENYLTLGVKIFGAGWFLLPFLNKKKQIFPFLLFIISVPFLFKTGNRTCFIYPLSSYILGSIFINLEDIKSTLVGFFKFKFNLVKTIKLFFLIILVLLVLLISIIIRLNRVDAIFGFDFTFAEKLSFFIENSDINFILESIEQSFSRIIFWQYISANIINPLIGFDGFWREIFFVYGPYKYDMEYMIDQTIGLGIVQLAGWETVFTYTTPNNIITEGAIRLGNVGGLIFYSFYILLTLIFAKIARFFNINKLLIIIFIVTSLIINLNQDSLAQTIKTSIYFILLGFLIKFMIRFLNYYLGNNYTKKANQ